jgi:proline iminopeptidase
MRAMQPAATSSANAAALDTRLAVPLSSGWLDVGEGHRVYFEDHGPAHALPVLIIHGGPGSGSTPRHREFFARERYRCIQLDQRGCGRSEPAARVVGNDTAALIADIERLRQHLGIARWLVFGGSWGAALALAYAAGHRPRVLGVLLRASFLSGQDEIERFFTGHPERAPQSRAALLEALGARTGIAFELDQLFAALDPLGLRPGSDACPRLADLAWRWQAYELALDGGGDRLPPCPEDPAQLRRLLAKYRIQAHYLARHCFLGTDAVLAAARQLEGLPVALVHGTADHICPVDNARRLLKACPGARLAWAEGAGHHPWQGDTPKLLRSASDCFAHRGSFDAWPEDQRMEAVR